MQSNIERQESQSISIKALSLAVILLVVVGLVVFLLANIGDFKLFLRLLTGTHYGWIALAIILQVLTYVFTGAVWMQVVRPAGYRLGWKRSSYLSLEQLAIDQVVPAGGLAGQTLIARSMVNLGLPQWLAIEAVLVGILSYHISFSVVSVVALALLWAIGRLTPLILAVAGIYFIIAFIVTWLSFLVAYNKTDKIPEWLSRKKLVSKFLESLKLISADKILSPGMLMRASFLRLIVFVLDVLTLWVVMTALKAPITVTVAFIALIVASLAGSASLMPGGVGGYEVGSTAALALLGVSVEAAIAGTVILRGLTLWLPLIPGIYFLKHQVGYNGNS